jgi:hypothetical protein
MTLICLTRNATIGFPRLGGAGQGRAGRTGWNAFSGALHRSQRCVCNDALAQEFDSVGAPISALADRQLHRRKREVCNAETVVLAWARRL